MFFSEVVFQLPIYRILFEIVFVLCCLTEVSIFSSTLINKKQSTTKKEKNDKGSMNIIMVGSVLSVIFNVIIAYYFGRFLHIIFYWIGIFITLVGIIIRMSSFFSLKKFFTVYVQVDENQKLYKKGIYKFIRHPAYLGSILMLIGIAMAYRTIIGILLTVVIIMFIYWYRINIEEKVLESNFGKEYIEYKKNTWRLIPYIW